MRTPTRLLARVVLLSASAVPAALAQDRPRQDAANIALQSRLPVTDPIPGAPIASAFGIVLREVLTFPRSEPVPETADPRLRRYARINHLGELPDGSRRRYVPDLNGTLYFVVADTLVRYLDVKGAVGPNFFAGRGLGSGFGFVTFHPRFRENGKFYTVHTEASGALSTVTPDFSTAAPSVVQGVVSEWTARDPAANSFDGTRRELLRIGFPGFVHGIQQIDFNPTATPGDADYGLLYVAVGDGGIGAASSVPQDLALPHGKILRIDPAGTKSANARYGVPRTNPFVSRQGALGEIYAYGMRDPHRFSWDVGGSHRMFLAHIGQWKVESIYEVRAGDNLGWSEREGFWVYDHDAPCGLYALPNGDARMHYVYPVAAFDHDAPPTLPCGTDAGHAIGGGFVYRGRALPQLSGKYLFTDIVTGRVMYAEERQMRRDSHGRPAPIHELAIFDEAGRETTLQLLAGDRRVDLRFGRDGAGEPYLLSKANGKVWKIVGTRAADGSPVLPSIMNDLVSHYDFEHPIAGDSAMEADQGPSGTAIRLVNGGARMRVADGAHPGSRMSIQMRQISPEAPGNDDWKAGVYAESGVATLRPFNGASGATVMGWFKMTGENPALNSRTPDPTDRYGAVGLAGVLSGTSDGHLVRALLELITANGDLRLAAVGRRVDDGPSRTLVATQSWHLLLPRGEWVFLAATFDFSTGKMALYRNGETLRADTVPGRAPGSDPGRLASATDPRGIKIGGSFPQNSAEQNPCDCRVDDLLFIRRALTPLEVSQQYRRMMRRR